MNTIETQTQTYHEEKLAASMNAFRRIPVLAHDRAESTDALCKRKKMHFCRSFILKPKEPVEAKPLPIKFAIQLAGLKLTQLVRRQKKFARLASTAKHLLAKLAPGPSKIRSAVESQQEECLARFKQVTAEIKARALAATGCLAETTE